MQKLDHIFTHQIPQLLRSLQQRAVYLTSMCPCCENPQTEVLQTAPNHGSSAQDRQAGLIHRAARGRRYKHLRFIQRFLPLPSFSQQSMHPGSHIYIAAGKMDAALFHIDLIPCQCCNFPRLHPQLPAHPDGKARGGAALLLDDAPEEVFPLVFVRRGRRGLRN